MWDFLYLIWFDLFDVIHLIKHLSFWERCLRQRRSIIPILRIWVDTVLREHQLHHPDNQHRENPFSTKDIFYQAVDIISIYVGQHEHQSSHFCVTAKTRNLPDRVPTLLESAFLVLVDREVRARIPFA